MDNYKGFFIDEIAVTVENGFLEFLKSFQLDPNSRDPYYETEIAAMEANESTTMFIGFSHVIRFSDNLGTAISDEYMRWKDLMMIGGSWNYGIINDIIASDLWNNNNNYDNNNNDEMRKGSRDLEEGVYYTLCGCYAFVAIVALVQLIRIQMRVPEYGWTTQKVFHFMNFALNGLRAIIFGLYKNVFRIRQHAFKVMLLDLPGLLFFSTYTLLVLFWAEIYHQARSLPTDTLRPTYYTANAIVYFIQIVIWISMRLSRSYAALEAAKVFLAVVSLIAALGFLTYGGRLFFMLRRFPIESRGRQKKLYEVGCVTVICCTCFLVRCCVAAISAVDSEVDVNVMDHPVANLLYYMVAEIVPSALVLFILRKLPPQRVSDQYHAIQ